MRKNYLKCVIALMAALAMMLGIPVVSHAAPQTMADGGLFDAVYYAANNPDVVAALGSSADMLYAHYVLFGKTEGRLPYAGQAVTAPVFSPLDIYNSLLASDGYVWVYYDPYSGYIELYAFDAKSGFVDMIQAGSLVDLNTVGTFCVATGNFLPSRIDYKVGTIDPNAVYLYKVNRASVSSIGMARSDKTTAYKIVGFDGVNLVLEIQTGYGIENRVFTKMSL